MMRTYGAAMITVLPLVFVACGGNSTKSDPQPRGGSGGSGGTGGSGGSLMTGGTGMTGGSGGAGASGATGGGFNTGGTGVAGIGTGGNAGATVAGSGGVSAASGSGGVAGAGQGGFGGAATAGSAGVAGSELGGEGGGPTVECPTDCEAQPSGLCGDDAITWVCLSGPTPDFQAGGCTDAATQVPRYCCPSTFLPECQ